MPRTRRLLAVAAALTLPLLAQQCVTIYKNFHRYPFGQYQQELTGFSESRPMGAPVTQVTCTNPLDPARLAAIKQLGNQVGAKNSCTTHVLRDEERTAESEQVCNPGPAQQTIHTTMHAIDDKTLKVETVSTLGPHKTTMLSTARYLGPCTPAQQAENAQAASMPMPAMPSLSKEQCTELAGNKREMNDAVKGCDDAPAEQRPTCVATMKAAASRVDKMLAACPH